MSQITMAHESRRLTLSILRLATLLFLAALQLAVCTLARGQTTDDPAPTLAPTADVDPDAKGSRYARSIDAALVEYERGNFEEAREHLRAAHEAYPNARTYRGLGKAEFELRNYGESVKMLEAALSSPVKALDDSLRAEVESILARARAYVGEVHVNVEPGSATVSVDGVLVASGPNAALALLVGDHVLEFRASGHLPERRAIRVKGGESMTVRVVLPSPESGRTEPRIVTLEPVPQQERVDGSAVRRRRLIWASVGTLIVGGIVTGAVLAARSGDSPGISGGTTDVVVQNP